MRPIIDAEAAVVHHAATAARHAIFPGDTEMARRMRALDWSATDLGVPARWPAHLRSAVQLCLTSRFPIVLWWGPRFSVLYNDGYIGFLGAAKHPRALGQPGEECWAEIWDTVAPMLEGVVATGEATWSEDFQFYIARRLSQEEGFFTFSYAPILAADGARVDGVFCPCFETTERVVGARRLETLRRLGERPGARTVERACRDAADVLRDNPRDVPFAAIYVLDATHGRASRVAEVAPRGEHALPESFALDDPGPSAWPLVRVLATQRAETVDLREVVGGSLVGEAWPDPVRTALVLPLALAGPQAAGLLVVGIGPRRVLDEEYRTFLDLAAGHVGATLAEARAHEDERRRVEALAELDRAKTTFFHNISHEFRTPLTLMLGPLEDALADEAPPLAPAHRDRVQLVRRNGLRLLRLVNTLLDFSRVEAGRAQARYAPVDLAALTADLASNFRSACERARLSLVVDCPPMDAARDGVAHVDRDMWETIVLNLVSNALKFTRTGTIAVALRAVDGRAELVVRDTGIGIPAAELPHVFERFRRVSGARGRTIEGSGIGLALVQGLVQLHGGSITVTSEPGRGSTFRVAIPLGSAHLPPDHVRDADDAGRAPRFAVVPAPAYVEEALRWADAADADVHDDLAPPGAPPATAIPADDRPRILWADDNADMREYVCRLLAPSYDVHAVADGETALRAAREQPPDLVLSDVMLPGMDGVELLRHLRAGPATRDIPVVLLSARAGEDSRLEGLHTGADDYVVKPFSSRELLARIDARVALARVRRESDRRVTRVLESISESCQIISPDWRVLYLNPVARSEYAGAGMDPDRMIGRHLWDELYPELRDGTAAGHMRRAMAERVSVGFESYWGPQDRWHVVRLDPLPDGGLACFFRDVTAQKRAEEIRQRLQQERDAALARLHLQFERMPIGCIVLDAEHRIIEWNPAAEAIFGHRRADVLGRDGPTVLLGRPAPPPLDAILQRIAAGDMAAHSVNENVTRDGRTIVCEWHNTPLRDADGAVVALLSMAQDITERVRSEEALRASEGALAAELTAMARLQEVSTRLVRAEDATPLLEEIIDAAIAITGAERGVVQLLDRDGEGLTLVAGRGFDAAYRERFRHMRGVRAAATEAVRTGERVVVEDVEASPLYAGSIALDMARAADVRAVQSTPLIARSGRLVGVLSTHYRQRGRPAERHLGVVDLLARQAADWIERTQAEDAVRESEERYRALVSQVRDYAIFSTDVHGVITTWNEGCHHVLGYARDEFVGLDVGALFTPEDRTSGVPRTYRRRLADGHAVQDERWMVAGGGRRFFAMGAATALRDAAGRPLGASVVLRDVTRMKLAQDALAHRGERLERLVSERTDALQRATERLRTSERMASLGTLAAGLGHDLGNLLLPLEARLQLLERAALPAELCEQVAGIASCVEYLQRLSGGLRLLATDPADTRLTEPTELGAWWKDISRLLQNVLPRDVAFEGSMPPTESWVSMGRAGLTQAVFNVVQNAADAMRGRGGGRVGVHVEPGPRPSTVAIDISDDGPGMTAEVLRRCAEPYFSTKPRGVSTGLGLALVHGLVTAAGGELTIASTPGAGTAVRLVLPGAILPERRPSGG